MQIHTLRHFGDGSNKYVCGHFLSTPSCRDRVWHGAANSSHISVRRARPLATTLTSTFCLINKGTHKFGAKFEPRLQRVPDNNVYAHFSSSLRSSWRHSSVFSTTAHASSPWDTRHYRHNLHVITICCCNDCSASILELAAASVRSRGSGLCHERCINDSPHLRNGDTQHSACRVDSEFTIRPQSAPNATLSSCCHASVLVVHDTHSHTTKRIPVFKDNVFC